VSIANNKILAIIPARSGSKGLPGKNLKPLLGKPLVTWSIEAASLSPSIDSIVLSTDDQKIANIGEKIGARVPFVRPLDLSGDTASSIDVVLHALDFLETAGEKFDIVVLLEPTSPQRDWGDIEQALDLLIKSGASSVVGVTQAQESHPDFMYRLQRDLKLKPFIKKVGSAHIRRQDIEPLYYLEGSIYISFVHILRERRSFYHEDTVGYEVPKWKSFEIDDLDDFIMIEALLKHKRQV
jgi:CMP-N,N'-diacetyllegionaminic acid synthase